MKGYTTIGLVGLDNRSTKLKSGNSDTMIIASINNDTKKVKLVSVYRDTYLRIGEDSEGNGQYSKANAAYAKGGAEQFLNMLNTNLDLNVTDFVSVDFQAVAEAVELLGGIDVELKEEEVVHLNNYCVETSKVTRLMDYTPLKKISRRTSSEWCADSSICTNQGIQQEMISVVRQDREKLSIKS